MCIHMHSYTQTHIYTNTLTCTHTHIYTNTHTCALIQTHIYTHTHTDTLTAPRNEGTLKKM